MDTIWYKHRTM